MKRIDFFDGDHWFLSNFYPAKTEYKGVTYPSSEHAYQAAKTLNPVQREEIRMLKTAGEAKKYGRKGPIDLRDGWDGMRVTVMREILRAKFSDLRLRNMLLSTGDAELIEGNTWNDRFWGQVNGVGENWLGRLLMELRAELGE